MSSISFFCAVCGEPLIAEPSFAGKVVECARCKRWVPVPGFPQMSGLSGCAAVYPAEILRMDVVFRCFGCSAKLAVDGRFEGWELVCPQCQTTVTAPLWSRSAVAPVEARTRRKEYPSLTPEEIGFLSGDLSYSLT